MSLTHKVPKTTENKMCYICNKKILEYQNKEIAHVFMATNMAIMSAVIQVDKSLIKCFGFFDNNSFKSAAVKS